MKQKNLTCDWCNMVIKKSDICAKWDNLCFCNIECLQQRYNREVDVGNIRDATNCRCDCKQCQGCYRR